MKTMSVVVTAIFLATPLCLNYVAEAINYNQLRLMAAKHNMTCILVFGDSSVDPGNNNYLSTPSKSNFLPYGEDFYSGHPSGRFSNGRLATDFIAEAFGYTDLVRAFLDPTITRKDMLHGVSFASAASGYDEFTANLSNVMSISKQLDYFRHYKIRIRNLVGTKESEEIVGNALLILSMGTNDFLVNYYVEPTRSRQYNIQRYQNYLISCMKTAIKNMHALGARKVMVVGVPPFGCMPLVRTLRDDIKCDA
ncbi:GDSL esterase/lipase [Sesamum alatum]|uniref:GDSL esterase/lipase n=1 Tax=Sesamum alatum TaxID=300844 RepID=A0AAE1Z0T8_9LAMI|nr:GDSL esterase/lipase [Sesamum alatum]